MFPPLNTPRLFLQQILPEDQSFIFEGLSDPDVIRFYGVSYDTFQSASVQMEWYEQMLKEGSGVAWKIVDRESKKAMGVVAVYLYKPAHKRAEVGFWILPQFWNRGYASEALRAAIDYWRIEKLLHRMEAFVEEGNNASKRILEKAGFIYEGTMKDCEIKNGKFISLQIFGLIMETDGDNVKDSD